MDVISCDHSVGVDRFVAPAHPQHMHSVGAHQFEQGICITRMVKKCHRACPVLLREASSKPACR